MKTKLILSLILILSLFAGPILAAAKPQSDDAIYDLVRRRLASDMVVKGGALDVEVKSGVVTLRGSVELEKQKTRAEKLAKKVSGVRSVVNELKVRRAK